MSRQTLGLEEKLAQILQTNNIHLTPVEGGLSHLAFACMADDKKYFVKFYTPRNATLEDIGNIREVNAFMLSKGLPASKDLFASNRFPRIAVQEFIEGEKYQGSIPELRSISTYYEKLLNIGLRNTTYIEKESYIAELNRNQNNIFNVIEKGLVVDPDLQKNAADIFKLVIEALRQKLPEQKILQIDTHDDFTEKNILMNDNKVALICDWDSYRARSFFEHLSATCSRFCLQNQHESLIDKSKLTIFFQSLSPEILSHIVEDKHFTTLLPYLACTKFLRLFNTKALIVYSTQKKGLQTKRKHELLEQPLRHCSWLLKNQEQVSQALQESIPTD